MTTQQQQDKEYRDQRFLAVYEAGYNLCVDRDTAECLGKRLVDDGEDHVYVCRVLSVVTSGKAVVKDFVAKRGETITIAPVQADSGPKEPSGTMEFDPMEQGGINV